MNSQFDTLLNILDEIRSQAPNKLRSIYLPPENRVESIRDARTRAYIHLYLLVMHGLLDFDSREQFITDDKFDGGLDAYYIDHQTKIRYLIQSKFHLSGQKFEVSQMSIDELFKMEIDRILRGEKKSNAGDRYNSRIRKFQKELGKTQGMYTNRVIILANVPHEKYKIKKVIGYDDFEVFDFRRSYRELVFPYCTSTYHVPNVVEMKVLLPAKVTPALDQYTKTRFGKTEVMIIFVPAQEIGRILSTYRNGILKENPRNYKGLREGKVNTEIRDSITKLETNEFAILNNGITVLCEDVNFDPHTGNVGYGRLILTKPQIINGGQTAFTLSDIYEHEFQQNAQVFGSKEVMVKIIKLKRGLSDRPKSVEMLSNATNRQNVVKQADRISSLPVLIGLQDRIYDQFGYFLERKEGEFYSTENPSKSGIRVLSKDFIIDRFDFIKAYSAFCGQPSLARSKGEKFLFSEKHIGSIFPNSALSAKAMFAYLLYRRVLDLEKAERKNNYGKRKYGFALRYGKYAIVGAVGVSENWNLTGNEDLNAIAEINVKKVLSQWKKFERQAKSKAAKTNPFPGDAEGFDNYYKGTTMDSDIKDSFRKK